MPLGIVTSDPNDRYLQIADQFLRDNTGARLSLSEAQRMQLAATMALSDRNSAEHKAMMNVMTDGFNMTSDGFKSIHSQLEGGFGAVIAAVSSSHAAEMKRMEEIMMAVMRINGNVDIINKNVQALATQLTSFMNEFAEYREADERNNVIQRAETIRVSIKQDIEKKFGHHDEMRRNAIGILQASDVGIIRKNTVVTRSEELMLATPNYWLSPAIVALASWFNDDRDVATAALAEAMHRDRDKTALFFALINRRAGRLKAAVRWLDVFLSNQTPHDVDYKCIVLLNAYAAGLFGTDNDSGISARMLGWLEELTQEPGFDERLLMSWTSFFRVKNLEAKDVSRKYMTVKALTTPEVWSGMNAAMRGAYLNGIARAWFENTLAGTDDPHQTRAQVDHLLLTLLSDFDEEEMELRRELDKQELIIGFDGFVDAANQLIELKDRVFGTRGDFIQILTNAAQFPAQAKASASTQNFAIALEMPWIIRSFTNITEDTESHVPDVIPLTIDDFTAYTDNGRNEREIVDGYVEYMNQMERRMLEEAAAKSSDMIMLIAGAVAFVLGIILCLVGVGFGFLLLFGIIFAIIGGLHIMRARNKQQQIRTSMAERRQAGVLVLRKAIAEVVDWRREFAKKFNESNDVLEYFRGISPEQQIQHIVND